MAARESKAPTGPEEMAKPDAQKRRSPALVTKKPFAKKNSDAHKTVDALDARYNPL